MSFWITAWAATATLFLPVAAGMLLSVFDTGRPSDYRQKFALACKFANDDGEIGDIEPIQVNFDI